jgi:MFS family permease
VGTYPSKLFYGWYIVAVGFFSQIVFAFHLSSTLSVFLKPLTEDLGVSRGLFSLLRSGEIIIGAMMSPFIGSWVDRYGVRWLMSGGALLAGMGFILLSQVTAFWQFLLIRWLLVTTGGAFISSMVVSVTIARWFVRKRGRAIAIATLGQGISKVGIPLVAATLFIWLGWRHTWSVFGIMTIILVIFPAIVFMRRSPEEMGLYPDGIRTDPSEVSESQRKTASQSKTDVDTVWTRREITRTSAFWLLCVTFGMANVGIAGLNLHVFAHITDMGYPSFIAATVMSIIAFTQLGSTLVWGFLSERWEIRKTTMLMFMIQAVGLGLAISTRALLPIYIGFFFYGVGLGGSLVLQEVIWATYYGRLSLGTVRGLAMLITLAFGAAGAPFFGFLFDATGSYLISFVLFALALLGSALLSLLARPPRKQNLTIARYGIS